MTLLQAHYTSCREGLGSGSGFQFAAASERLDDRLAELERIVLYQPPPGSPAAPSEAEISAMPVRLQYREVYDGMRVLSRSRYLGRDYSGRFGNFFTHVIVLDDIDVDLGEQLPIELFGLPVWAERETGERRLPEVRLSSGHGDGLGPALQVLRDPRRINGIARFADGLLEALTGGRRVVVVDEPAAASAWIQLGSRCLPPNLGRDLTFSSFEAEPRRTDVALAITTPDADLSFAAYELEADVKLINVTGTVAQDDLAPAPGAFGRLVAFMVYRGDEEPIRAFGAEVASRLVPAPSPNEAGAALALHVGAGEGLSGAELRAVLDLLSARPSLRFGVAELDWVFDELPDDQEGLEAVQRTLDRLGTKEGCSADALRDLALAWLVNHPTIALTSLPPNWRPAVAPRADLASTWAADLGGLSDDDLLGALALGTQLSLAGDGRAIVRHARRIVELVEQRADERTLSVVGTLPDAALNGIAPVLAERVGGDLVRAKHLGRLLGTDGMRRAISATARRASDFHTSLLFTCLCLATEPDRGAEFLGQLAQCAETDEDIVEALTLTFSSHSPASVAEAAAVLGALREARLPKAVLERTLSTLKSERLNPFSPEAAHVVELLAEQRCPRPAVADARDVLRESPDVDADVRKWCTEVLRLLWSRDLGASQLEELEQALAERVVRTTSGRELGRLLADVSAGPPSLAKELARSADRLLRDRSPEHAAALFEATYAHHAGPPQLRNAVSAALDRWKEKEREAVATRLQQTVPNEWQHWASKHPAPVSLRVSLQHRFLGGRVNRRGG